MSVTLNDLPIVTCTVLPRYILGTDIPEIQILSLVTSFFLVEHIFIERIVFYAKMQS